jgi:hypothetical protein
MAYNLKGTPRFEEENHGAHYYAYSPEISTSLYSEAFANIVLPTSLDNTPYGVPATYTKRNAYIALGISSPEGGVDLGITNTGSGWKPVSYDVKSKVFTTYDNYIADSTATNALIVVKPVSSTKVGLYVNFVNSSGTSVTMYDSSNDGDITVGSRTTWNYYYRFASLVQDPGTATDYRTDSTYMLGGSFTNLGLYNTNTSSYSTWGINGTLIEKAWIMYYPKCQVSYTSNSDSFTIDHWA